MPWFFIALLNPILHAGVNHFDKYLISKYFKNIQVGSLVIFSALFAIILLPIVAFLAPDFMHVSFVHGLILTVNGMLIVVAVICYLYALDEDEATFVVPLFQMIPIFGLILGFVFLGEVITVSKILAGLIIIAGAATLSVDLQGSKIRLKKKVVILILLSSLCYAINIIIFKSIAVENGFGKSLFWDLTGKTIFGLLLLLFVGSYRKSFFTVLKTYGASFVILNGFNELLSIAGDWALAFSALLAPVFFVQTVSTIQPIFVFIFGYLITVFFPRIGKETLKRKILYQKLIGICVVIVGGLLLAL